MVKSIIIMRHAEREDRAMESRGMDWISTAPRPQDPMLSEKGKFIYYYSLNFFFCKYCNFFQ